MQNSKLKLKIKKFKEQLGFTLVELLIVISIIGVLSTLLTANLIGVRQRGRDAHRKSDLRQIQSALELYRADQGSYPTALPSCGSPLTGGNNTYLQKVPCDPSGPTVFYTYTTSNGTTYSIVACLENGNDSEAVLSNGNPPCNTTTGFSYTLNNP